MTSDEKWQWLKQGCGTRGGEKQTTGIYFGNQHVLLMHLKHDTRSEKGHQNWGPGDPMFRSVKEDEPELTKQDCQ